MTEFSIRPATPEDARALAELMDMAGEGIPSWLWAQDAAEGQSALEVGMSRAKREEGAFCYRNVTVLALEQGVAGMLLAYRLPDEMKVEEATDGVPDFLVPLVELECLAPATFYINAIALYPKHRSKGYGAYLMAEAERLAREQGADTLSLIAFDQNDGAVRLYRRLGFDIVASREVVPHESYTLSGRELLMTRVLT